MQTDIRTNIRTKVRKTRSGAQPTLAQNPGYVADQLATVSKQRPGLRKPQNKDILLLIGEDMSNCRLKSLKLNYLSLDTIFVGRS